MSRYSLLPVALCFIGLLSACRQQPSSTEAQREGLSSQTADSGTTQSGPAVSAESEMDYGQWLRLPPGIAERYAVAYPSLVKSAMAEDVHGYVNLAVVSQQIATELERSALNDQANDFFAQSGRALRAALPEGAQLLRESAIATIFFEEACALSRTGKAGQAIAALHDAVAHGFTNLSAISSEDDLTAVRQTPEFDQHMQDWQEAIVERFRAEAHHDLANGETFPFELVGTDIRGNEVSLEKLIGKVVIVDIWGTWCPPCRAEIPSFIKLQDTYGQEGFQIIGLNFERLASDEENLEAVVKFAAEMGINYPCILGNTETLSQVPSMSGFPTTLFIDKSGKVRMKIVGLHDYHYLEAVVQELLTE